MELPSILHLHTHFLFPFSIDKSEVIKNHPDIWSRYDHWMDGLDEWIAAHNPPGSSPIARTIGVWQRAAYTRFDMNSQAYQDMVFFHPFVRRVFFDTREESAGRAKKSRCCERTAFHIGDGKHLYLYCQ